MSNPGLKIDERSAVRSHARWSELRALPFSYEASGVIQPAQSRPRDLATDLSAHPAHSLPSGLLPRAAYDLESLSLGSLGCAD